MEDINTKIEDSGATADGRLSADEFNDRNDELETAVERSGQTLTVSETTQLAESLFLNGTKAHSFQDNGAVNAVDLRPISGASGVKVPVVYANMDGAIVSFKPAVNNTGAVTVDIGQTAGIGTNPLVLSTDFSALTGGELDITITAQIQFDLGGSRWLLLPWSLPAAVVSFPIPVSQGGTGSTTVGDAQTSLDVPPKSLNLTVSGLLTGGGNLASDRNFNVVRSSQAQAEAGTDNNSTMTPVRVAQAIAALAEGGGGLSGIQTFDSAGADTWNKPAGVTSVLIYCTGGGGGGGGWSNLASSGGGGGSGATVLRFYDVTALASLALIVGAAGAQGNSGGQDGGNGGSSTVVDDVTTIANAGAGGGGVAGTNITVAGISIVQGFFLGGDAGNAVTGDTLIDGAQGLIASIVQTNNALTVDIPAGTGASTESINYGSGVRHFAQGGAGAPSYWGGGGPATAAGYSIAGPTFNVSGVTPTAPGAGGGGAAIIGLAPGFASPSAGAPGIIVILEFGG